MLTKCSIIIAFTGIFFFIFGCAEVQQMKQSATSSVSSVSYDDIDFKRWFSGLFDKEFEGKHIKAKLVFFSAGGTLTSYAGTEGKIIVVTYPPEESKLVLNPQQAVLANPQGYGEAMQHRMSIPVDQSYRDLIFRLKKGDVITVYGRVQKYNPAGLLLFADKIEVSQ
jgi:hypothetical protein